MEDDNSSRYMLSDFFLGKEIRGVGEQMREIDIAHMCTWINREPRSDAVRYISFPSPDDCFLCGVCGLESFSTSRCMESQSQDRFGGDL